MSFRDTGTDGRLDSRTDAQMKQQTEGERMEMVNIRNGGCQGRIDRLREEGKDTQRERQRKRENERDERHTERDRHTDRKLQTHGEAGTERGERQRHSAKHTDKVRTGGVQWVNLFRIIALRQRSVERRKHRQWGASVDESPLIHVLRGSSSSCALLWGAASFETCKLMSFDGPLVMAGYIYLSGSICLPSPDSSNKSDRVSA